MCACLGAYKCIVHRENRKDPFRHIWDKQNLAMWDREMDSETYWGTINQHPSVSLSEIHNRIVAQEKYELF